MSTASRGRWNALTKEASAAKRAAGLHQEEGSSRIAAADLKQLRRLLPIDTRDLTAAFCGDPLPGRSALDRRRAEA